MRCEADAMLSRAGAAQTDGSHGHSLGEHLCATSFFAIGAVEEDPEVKVALAEMAAQRRGQSASSTG